MGRPAKQGLDYFYVVCDPEEKVEYLEAKHGIIGFGVLIKLWRRVYKRHGYWCEWDERSEIMFAKKVGITVENLREIITTCFDENIFSLEKYEKYKVLTSSGVQKHFLEVCRRAKRSYVAIDVKYSLLIEIQEENIVNSGVNSGLFRKIREEMPQSKVKESKVNNTISPSDGKNIVGIKPKDDIKNLVEKKKKVAPKKKGKNPDSEPYWKEIRFKWIWFNKTHLRFDPQPIPERDYSHMKKIIEKLRERAIGQAVEWSEKNALERWEKFLTIAFTKDDWLGKNFLLGNLESKMQKIFNLIDNPNGQHTKTGRQGPTSSSVGKTIEFDRP